MKKFSKRWNYLSFPMNISNFLRLWMALKYYSFRYFYAERLRPPQKVQAFPGKPSKRVVTGFSLNSASNSTSTPLAL